MKSDLNTFMKATNDGIILHKNDEILLINQAMSKLTGYSEEELYDLKLSDIIPDKSKKKLTESQTLASESLIHTKNGKRIYIELQEKSIQFKKQLIVATVVRDISKRKAVEEALREERRNRLLGVIDGSGY